MDPNNDNYFFIVEWIVTALAIMLLMIIMFAALAWIKHYFLEKYSRYTVDAIIYALTMIGV